MKRTGVLIIILSLAISCSNKDSHRHSKDSKDYTLAMAILYNYYSSEYEALANQAFNIATERLDKIADTAVTIGKYAVVVDIDETVLDNSPYQAKAIVEGFSYPEGWDEWCNMAVARPVPGALDFLNHADSIGYRVFYLSNRKNEFVYQGTYENLKNLGFPQLQEENILLRMEKTEDNPDPSDKEARREQIRNMGYGIVLLVGDNLGDFYTDSTEGNIRNQQVVSAKGDFGNEYILLPNAMYGNWPAAVGLDGSREKVDSLLRIMSNIY